MPVADVVDDDEGGVVDDDVALALFELILVGELDGGVIDG